MSPLPILIYRSAKALYTNALPGLSSGRLGERYRRVFMQLGLSTLDPLVCTKALSTI